MGERTAEEWGRMAMALPGWRWMPGMRVMSRGRGGERALDVWPNGTLSMTAADHINGATDGPEAPDPDDPATAGCLLALLGAVAEAVWFSGDCSMWAVQHDGERLLYTSLGRACIAAAAAIGEWPGGAE